MSDSRKNAKRQRLNKKRKIIVYIATSVDGYIARIDGGVDWLDRPRPKGNYGMGEFWKSIDTILLGRKSYDCVKPAHLLNVSSGSIAATYVCRASK
jgi:hypothetical protein